VTPCLSTRRALVDISSARYSRDGSDHSAPAENKRPVDFPDVAVGLQRTRFVPIHCRMSTGRARERDDEYARRERRFGGLATNRILTEGDACAWGCVEQGYAVC